MAFLAKIGQVLNTEISKDLIFKKKELEENTYSFLEDMKKRRSYYELSNRVSLSPEYLTQLIKEAARCCPSALNSQSARIVILLEDSHFKFWKMVKEVQHHAVAEAIWESMDVKVDRCASAFGTVLFFEDQDIIQSLQKRKPLQAEEFQLWSEQTSGMVQYAVWTAIASTGLGASIHHFNPSIDQATTDLLDLPKQWQLKAQLVFGSILETAVNKNELNDEVIFRVLS
ncbi:nitroreductase family protein [Acinetobacter wuhouensis]|uniref:Nitroreductase domain-containing protein n=1 Tax=Acinetobacter wuhouensis TaxID=1879050 RepID=A0A4Q7AD38_9GAMM|nr:nitroreductase family protein [Acinetobacter wuhouensis]RZG44101.1 hypothetical protein EXU28_15290 [Acinetobacter wuhouensis]